MCTADLSVFGDIWWDPLNHRQFPHFNRMHQCKNYTAVREWAKQKQIPERIPKDFYELPKGDDKVYDRLP
jgi:hypothetical protein